MKKTAVAIVAVILSVFCSVSVFAVNDLPEDKTADVLAKAVYTLPDGSYGAEEDDGDYTAELPDGVKITLTPKAASPSLKMVIVPITEKDEQAYRWVLGCTTDLGTDPLFYDIYFVDEFGNRVDVNMTLDVSIALMNECGTLRAAEISADGRASQLDSKSGGNKISFTIKKGGYYAIASAHAGTSIPSKTGDTGLMNLWIVLLFAFGAGIAVTAIKKKNRYAKQPKTNT